MGHSEKYEDIKGRYFKNWVTDGQLTRYVELQVVTAAEMQEIMKAKDDKEKEEAIEI